MISCIVLSAGESRRFGSPKALVPLGGKKAIKRIQQTLLDCAVVDEIIVVLGDEQELIRPHVFNHNKVRLVYNKDYKFGQTTSFQAGVASAGAFAQGFMLFPVDCPLIAAGTVEELVRLFNEKNPAILVPVHQSRRGHPPIFNVSLKKDILDLPPEKGINTLFIGHPPMTVEVKDKGILKTFNTLEELGKII